MLDVITALYKLSIIVSVIAILSFMS